MSSGLRLVTDPDPEPSSAQSRLPAQAGAIDSFALRNWTVHPSLNRIVNGVATEQLEPRIMHVLVCLASCPGKVVSRKELLETVWHDVLVGEEVLTRAISQLRLSLKDEPKQPRYIETIRGGGYRLVAPVAPVTGPGPVPVAQDPVVEQPAVPIATRAPARWSLLALGLALATTALLAIGLPLWHGGVVATTPTPPAPQESFFTTYPLQENLPSFSPTGVAVSFVSDVADGKQLDLYVKQRNTDEPLRLTRTSANEVQSTWSPDGSAIAFSRAKGGKASLHMIPAIGGPERVLSSGWHQLLGFDWAPDGSAIVFAARRPEDSTFHLHRLSLPSLEVERLTDPPLPPVGQLSGDYGPAFSPDGERLAFVRVDASGRHCLHLMPAAGGEQLALPADLGGLIEGLDWAPDGEHLIVSAAPEGRQLLWKVRISDGSRSWLPTLQAECVFPSVDQASGSVVYEQRYDQRDLWGYRFGELADGEERKRPIFMSTKNEEWPALSFDNRRVAYFSDRSGRWQVWMSSIDGSAPQQLTNLEHLRPQRLRWAPDNRHLAFSAELDGSMTIQVLDSDTGRHWQLDSPDRHEAFLDFSAESHWLYYNLVEDERWSLWRRPRDGGAAERLPVPDGELGEIRFFDSWLYFRRQGSDAIWRWCLDSGREELVTDAAHLSGWNSWAVTEAGIFLVPRVEPNEQCSFGLLDPATGVIRQTGVAVPIDGLSVFSHDGTLMVVSLLDQTRSDLVLLDGILSN